MPKPSKPYASPFGNSSEFRGRKQVADALYLDIGAEDAKQREQLNSEFGIKSLLQVLSESLELQPGQVVYDIACGSGTHLKHFNQLVGPDGTSVGLDYSPEAVANTRKLGLQCVQSDATTLPFNTASADAVNCAYGVYYFSDLKSSLSEFYRVLKPNGKAVVCGPATDTNRELYEFHHRVTNLAPSDADNMALGYVEERVATEMLSLGFTVNLVEFENTITFPSDEQFLYYWSSTSLFRRTVLANDETRVLTRAEDHLKEQIKTMSLTKKTTIAIATKLV